MEREFVRHAADQAVVDRDPTPSLTLVFKGCEDFRRFRTLAEGILSAIAIYRQLGGSGL